MSYEPTNWQSGDVVTAEKLNKMETAIAALAGEVGTELVYLYFGYDNETDKTYYYTTDNSIFNKTSQGFVLLFLDPYSSQDVVAMAETQSIQAVNGTALYATAYMDINGFGFTETAQPVTYTLSSDNYIVVEESGTEETRYVLKKDMSLVPLTITLTPTAQDYSGTMDKTPQEITDAYNAGRDIEFDIPSLVVKCKAMEFAVTGGVIQAGAIVTYRTGGSHLLIEALTDATNSTYATHIYQLTPMA